MSTLTTPAEGIAGQLLFAAVAMLSSGGAIKAGFPLVDDEGRDVEVHLAGKFLPAFAIQVKVSTRLRPRGNYGELRMAFDIGPENVIDHPCYWYLFAYIDPRVMQLAECLFMVPSKEVHAHLSAKRYRGKPFFVFCAGMEPDAHDLWSPYRVKPADLGKHLVELMQEAPKGLAESEAFAALAKRPGLCLLGTAPQSQVEGPTSRSPILTSVIPRAVFAVT